MPNSLFYLGLLRYVPTFFNLRRLLDFHIFPCLRFVWINDCIQPRTACINLVFKRHYTTYQKPLSKNFSRKFRNFFPNYSFLKVPSCEKSGFRVLCISFGDFLALKNDEVLTKVSCIFKIVHFFEPWVWRRLKPFPACSLVSLFFFQTDNVAFLPDGVVGHVGGCIHPLHQSGRELQRPSHARPPQSRPEIWLANFLVGAFRRKTQTIVVTFLLRPTKWQIS